MTKNAKTKYTEVQFKKDSNKIIGVGFLILSLFLITLFFWNLEYIEKKRKDIKIEEKLIFKEMPSFDEIMKQGLETLKKEENIYVNKIFKSFSVSISSKWELIEEEKFLEYSKKIEEIRILLLAHNFNPRQVMIRQLSSGNIMQNEASIEELIISSGIVFGIIDIKNLKNYDSLKNYIKTKNKDDFNIKIEKWELDLSNNSISAKYSILDPTTQKKVIIYSYKKEKVINQNNYVFVFLKLSEILEQEKKILDKIYNSAIIK